MSNDNVELALQEQGLPTISPLTEYEQYVMRTLVLEEYDARNEYDFMVRNLIDHGMLSVVNPKSDEAHHIYRLTSHGLRVGRMLNKCS